MINVNLLHNVNAVHAEWQRVGARIDRSMRAAMRQYAEEVATQVQEDIGRGGFERASIGGRTWRIDNKPKAQAPDVYRRTGELAGSINAQDEKKRGQWIGKVGSPKKVGLYLWKGTQGGAGHGKAIPLQVITKKPEKDEKGRDKWVRVKRRGAIKPRPYFETAAGKKEKRGGILIDRAVRRLLKGFSKDGSNV